jgi:hypothetical protein
VVNLSAHPGADRVRPDVVAGVGEVLVVSNHPGMKPGLKEVASPFVALIEPLRVKLVELLEPV